MTASECLHGEREPDLQALAPGAEPEVIREILLPEDRGRFDAALARAHASHDEDRIWTCVERWRAIAVLQAGRQRFRRLARRIAERTTGVPSPEDEPLEVTRAKAHGAVPIRRSSMERHPAVRWPRHSPCRITRRPAQV